MTNRVHLYRQRFSQHIPPALFPTLHYLKTIWSNTLYPNGIAPFLHGGSLSGLPLLMYISHILWSCRALEEVLSSSNDDEKTSFTYLRTILTLSTTSLLLELYTLHFLLRNTTNTSTPSLFTAGHPTQLDDYGRFIVPNGHSILLNRPVGTTFTSTICALMMVYQGYFPHVPLPLFPIFSSVQIKDAGLSHVACMILLMCTSYKVIHPTLTIVYGMTSGALWVLGFTSWISLDSYWGNGFCWVAFFGIALSLRAAASAVSRERRRRRSGRGDWGLSDYIPCIDYVSWDERGRVLRMHDEEEEEEEDGENSNHGGSEANVLDISSSSSLQDISSTTMTSANNGESTMLARRTISNSSNGSARYEGENQQQQIRGRLPFMSSLDSELDDDGGGGTSITPTASNATASRSFSNGGGGGLSSGNVRSHTD